MKKLYLYLLKRNKKDVKIIGSFLIENTIHPTRIQNLDVFDLKPKDKQNVQSIVNAHKLDWEIWAESAESHVELMQNLQNRGHEMFHSSNTPLIKMESQLSKSAIIKLNKNRIMTRRMN